MSTFLEKFKGKTNLITKEGLHVSLDKPCIAITKNLPYPKSLKPIILPKEKPLKAPKSAFLNEKSLRARKIYSFSSQSNKIKLKEKSFIIRTESDLPNKKIISNLKKLTPNSLRTTPLQKAKHKIDNLKTEVNLPLETNNIIMEKIEEKDEFEEAQRLHYDFLTRIEKMGKFD